ncbi:PAS domain-containing sensor histidine kinase [Loktanella fryxellensis]|nr:PAS domain-containing sensor histidine kinase [Loktanella fryxellensis]
MRSALAALNAHAMVVTTNAAGRVTSVNDVFVRTTGHQRADVIGMTPGFYPGWDDAAQADMPVWTGDRQVVTDAGTSLWTKTTRIHQHDAHGQFAGMILIHADTSDQRTAETDRDAVASLHLLSEPVFIVAAGTHRVVFANAAAMTLFGWAPDALDSVDMASLDLACDRGAVTDQIARLEAGEIDQFAFDADYDGVSFRADMQVTQLPGQARRLYVILRNQTEVLAVSRAKDELVATVSHELRTPLTSIKGALGLIQSGAAGPLSDKARGLLDIAYRNADRLVLIVNDILDLEKLEAGHMDYDMQRHDLTATLQDAIAMTATYAARFDVAVNLRADTHPAWADFDTGRIHQVLLNLISNACKFSPRGTQIDVVLVSGGDRHRVSVVDRGAGIPADALDRVFDRFTQVGKSNRARGGGTGLGLSIVKAIVESHGGQVALESVEGQGTSVSFTLSRRDAPVQAVSVLQMSGTRG